jgi:hypothetical protein
MLIILLSLIISVIAIIVLFKATLNLSHIPACRKNIQLKSFLGGSSLFVGNAVQKEHKGGDIITLTTH